MQSPRTSNYNRAMIVGALVQSFRKLNPVTASKNVVMFVVYVGAIFCTIKVLQDPQAFYTHVTIWLWFTILFANFAESIAEGRGKAQAQSLRASKKDVSAKKIIGRDIQIVPAPTLQIGDLVVCEAGDVIPSDGDVVEGVASINESAITGESAPVIRESGGDRCAVTAGTTVLSDRIVVKITAAPGNTFIDRMIHMVEGAKRKATPNEIALNILLIVMTLVFIVAVMTLQPFSQLAESTTQQFDPKNSLGVVELVALLVCLIPTTIGGLLSAIGISGIDRMIRKNVIATSGKAVEAAGDVDVLLMDKTGTITLGNRMASSLIPLKSVEQTKLWEAAYLASMQDDTPEGRSIIQFIEQQSSVKDDLLKWKEVKSEYTPFSAQTRMSGSCLQTQSRNFNVGAQIRKGAIDSMRKLTQNADQHLEEAVDIAHRVAQEGATPLILAADSAILGVIVLKDTIKPGITERFAALRKMGIKTIMITGDNPLTASAIAKEAGVDDFVAEATPETKLKIIRDQQAKGHMVAMIGDGTNDAPALAQSDVGVAMNTGTQAAREAANMVDLDSNPTKLIEVVETGKQMLMTRGALTTFSIANDVAKYFAILPALFAYHYSSSPTQYGPLESLNIMHLNSAHSAILSSVIFNALIIIALIPLALRGVNYKPLGAEKLLRNNMIIYGLGGLIVPFLGIKLIDIIISIIGVHL
jgi:potassium-transporting ATPase ATP-binding subunit